MDTRLLRQDRSKRKQYTINPGLSTSIAHPMIAVDFQKPSAFSRQLSA
jgi:hypothetical protein